MKDRIRRTAAVLGAGALLSTAGVQQITAQAAHAAPYTNYIHNDSATGGRLGIIINRNSTANYDALLPDVQNTYDYFNLRTVAGWYTGPGYCSRQWRKDFPNSPFYRQWPNLGPGRHLIGSTTTYIVSTYPAQDSNCANDT
ncbi:hypothetical protein AB0F81_35500 [Actinoplanes sp. NPDC024001]|uniref:hypothetical protein n=1 Tax=Actinoplanes sp. NPDC024001 TaxID=3154598 RepID=UPI0033FF287D